jgi:uracil-DNA glycosylase
VDPAQGAVGHTPIPDSPQLRTAMVVGTRAGGSLHDRQGIAITMNISKKKIEHVGPLDAKIFILGEAPNQNDDYFNEPFTESEREGKLLSHFLSLAGINREDCRIGNVCNYHPNKNDFTLLHGSKEYDEGTRGLTDYINSQRPQVIIALGDEALRYLKGHGDIHNWRGSILPYVNNSFIIPTYHPSSAIWDGTLAPQIVSDLEKAARVHLNGYKAPIHDFIIDPDEATFSKLLQEVRDAEFVAADIESIRDTQHILCIGFAVSSTRAFCIKNHSPLGSGIDSVFDRRLRECVEAAKDITFHNGGFDTEMLRLNGIMIDETKFKYDTMLAQRVLQPELPIGLDFCASIYTDEPYYKGDGKETGKRIPQTLWEYNCKDCVVTFATRIEQEKLFDADEVLKADCDFIFARIPLMQEFQRNGMLVDEERRNLLKAATESKLLQSANIVSISTGYKLNFRSPKQVKELLYTILKLPHRTDRKGNLTTDEDAIVSLLQYVQGQIDDKKTDKGRDPWILKLHALRSILDIRGNEKLISSYFDAQPSLDGRIRSSYKPAGTDTGRWSCSTYVDGSGLNAQTLPRLEMEITL